MRRVLDFVKLLVLLIGLALAAGLLGKFATQEISGDFRAIDGDSVRLGNREIRLFGIDAPEYRQMCAAAGGNQYPCGKQAAQHLRKLADGKDVICSGQETDKYDRLLAVCNVGDVELNRQMVLAGWAVSFGAYEREESLAQSQTKGIWKGGFDLPKDWRRNEAEKHSQGWLSGMFGW